MKSDWTTGNFLINTNHSYNKSIATFQTNHPEIAIGVQSMHMTKNIIEGNNQTSFWSTCLMLVTAFAIADVFTGGLLRESVVLGTAEYAVAFALVIATVGVYASDGPPGLRFIRSCSRHKL